MMQAGHNKAATSVNFSVFACNYCQKELKEKAVIKPTYFLTGDFELRTLHVCLFMVGSMFHCRQQWKPMHASTNKPVLLAALLLALAPALSQAADAALPPPPSAQLSSPVAKLPSLASTAKAGGDDGYKETDVWGRIRTGFAIPDLNNELVAKHITWYTSRPDYIARTSARASLYLFHVVTELEKRGMPTELALLPFIESAFNPNALSSANAAGMWQFVPGTGRDLNLKQTAFKDDRRGIIASTDAALAPVVGGQRQLPVAEHVVQALQIGQGGVGRGDDAAAVILEGGLFEVQVATRARHELPHAGRVGARQGVRVVGRFDEGQQRQFGRHAAFFQFGDDVEQIQRGARRGAGDVVGAARSEEHTSEL